MKLVAIIGQLYDNILYLIWLKLTCRQFSEPGCYHTWEFSKITSNLNISKK